MPVGAVVRVGHLLELESPGPDVFAVRVQMFADLDDGRRVTDADYSGTSLTIEQFSSLPQAPTLGEVEEQARSFFADESPRERWLPLRRALRKAGVRTRAGKLERLPMHYEFDQRLREAAQAF